MAGAEAISDSVGDKTLSYSEDHGCGMPAEAEYI
jgi:hypothetical protein